MATTQDLRGFRALARRDGDFRRVLRLYGPPPERRRPPGFGTLLRILVAQQISTAAADGIWRRLEIGITPLNPERVLAFDIQGLRGFGLSLGKARYAQAIAQALLDGTLDLEAVATADDEAAIALLTEVKGIGRWSAELYLLIALARPDVWPAADLALMTAAQRLKALPLRPDTKAMTAMAEAWRPWRAHAARLLWHYYRHEAARPDQPG
ncbi:MAG: DNA-3-methyladenine glycosylase 2 family protein [Alphaproteobacteria bacterium]|nr:DNA-3-methyladenine glycosylase 2 family protein [Alphaproteobacteria bacterium]